MNKKLSEIMKKKWDKYNPTGLEYVDLDFNKGFQEACEYLIPLLKKASIVVHAHAETTHLFDGFKGRTPDNEWDILSKKIFEVIE